jgi:hypothetical protein
MKKYATSIIFIGLILLVAFLGAIFAAKKFLVDNAPLIVVAKDLASVLGLIGLVAAVATYTSSVRARQSNRKLERVKLSIDLMSRFYQPPELEEIRRSLREHKKLTRPPEYPNSLRWDEVWVMNFFESLAISIDEGLLDIKLVNKMFGSPILEVAQNPSLLPLVYDAAAEQIYSYEGYIRALYLPICELRGIKPKIKILEKGGGR